MWLNLVSLLERYPSGVTMAIVLSDLQNLVREHLVSCVSCHACRAVRLIRVRSLVGRNEHRVALRHLPASGVDRQDQGHQEGGPDRHPRGQHRRGQADPRHADLYSTYAAPFDLTYADHRWSKLSFSYFRPRLHRACTDILKLQDEHSKRKIEWYLHQKFYPLVAKGLLTEVRTSRTVFFGLVVCTAVNDRSVSTL